MLCITTIAPAVSAIGLLGRKVFWGDMFPATLKKKWRYWESEGVIFREGIIDLDCCGFLDFQTDYPLQRLQKFQESWAEKIVLRERSAMPDRIAGVDLAYPGEKEGQAAYALVDTASGKLVWSKKIRRPVHFPYITTFLAFRELPLLLELFDEVRREGQMAEIVLVDGSGILHPRHVGVASHLGAITKTTTIGRDQKITLRRCGYKRNAAGRDTAGRLEESNSCGSDSARIGQPSTDFHFTGL